MPRQQPLTHAEIFIDLLYELVLPERRGWDNLASDKGEYGKTGGVLHETSTFEGCKKICEKDEKCLQYSYYGNTCSIGMSVRIGFATAADEKGVWRSGWHTERIEKWLAEQPLCNEIIF
jgi:hypothetical protein